MKRALAEAVAAELREDGVDPRARATPYSGRGMYGRKTWAVDADVRCESDVRVIVATHSSRAVARSLRTDNLGRQNRVWY